MPFAVRVRSNETVGSLHRLHQFLLSNPQHVDEGLHRRLTVAPAPLMRDVFDRRVELVLLAAEFYATIGERVSARLITISCSSKNGTYDRLSGRRR
jgi:hypothetical protein